MSEAITPQTPQGLLCMTKDVLFKIEFIENYHESVYSGCGV